MSALTKGQSTFASVFARETGLNPQVVGAWLLAEQSGDAAKNYESKGYHNWLNIAQTDSGPAGGAHSPVWRNPERAARASAEWIKGQGPLAHEYGHPSSGIASILSSAGQSPHRQIQAIANSGWASSGYEHGHTLSQLLGTVQGIGVAPGRPGSPLTGATREAASESFTTRNQTFPTFNTTAFEEAAQHAKGLREAASLFKGGGPADSLLREVLERAGTPPEPKGFAGSEHRLVRTPNGTMAVAPNSGPTNALTNAVPHGTKLSGFLPGNAELIVRRKDQGQDVKTNPGGPILAPGDGHVLYVKNNPGGFGVAYPVVHFDTGPLKGHDVYIGHTRSALGPGARFHAGDKLSYTGNGQGPFVGNATGLPGWAEIGLWTPSGPIQGGETGGRQIAPLLGLR